MEPEPPLSDEDLAKVLPEAARHVGDAMLVTDGETVLWANGAAAKVLGVPRDALVGGPYDGLLDRVVPEDRDRVRGIIDARRRGEEAPDRYEVRVERPDGGQAHVEVSVASVPERGLYVVVGRDVTERRETERTLRESEARLRGFFERTTVGFYRTTPDGEILWANPALAEMLGFDSVDELEAMDLSKWGYPDADQRRAWVARMRDRDEVRGHDTVWTRKDGSTIHVRESARTVRDADGELLYFEGTVEDLTTVKEAQRELERANRDLERANRELERRNRELDQFAYIISHDLKAPLRAVAALAEWIEEDAGDALPPSSLEDLRLLRQRAGRLNRMVDALFEYARVGREAGEVETVDAGRLVREVVDLIQPPEGVTVEVDEPLPTVRTEPVRLQQVLQNLVANAVAHRRPDAEGGTVRVWAEQAVPRDGWVTFHVADDGPGIPAEQHDRIFEIFRTLAPADEAEGTGVGLALVKKIVEAEGGTVRVESAPGEGATFSFTWPKVRVPPFEEV